MMGAGEGGIGKQLTPSNRPYKTGRAVSEDDAL